MARIWHTLILVDVCSTTTGASTTACSTYSSYLAVGSYWTDLKQEDGVLYIGMYSAYLEKWSYCQAMKGQGVTKDCLSL